VLFLSNHQPPWRAAGYSGRFIKVIVRDGEVTLKGSVKGDDQRAAIESKAASIAGTGKVQNQSTVQQ
jgi:osmotically-inducible protein OsmY